VSTAPPLAIPSKYNPHADGLAGVPTKDSRTVNTVEREVFIKQLTNLVHTSLRSLMISWFNGRKGFSFWPRAPYEIRRSAETFREIIELKLRKRRTKDSTCGRSDGSDTCSPCLNKEQCISIASTELLMK
jgi:hypothetical protein